MKFPKDPKRSKKQKQPDKKPRSVAHSIVITVDDIPEGTEYIPLDWHHNITTGETSAYVAGKKVLTDGLTMTYNRPNKTSKTVVRMEDTGTTNRFDVLLKNFDMLIAIDTNTATIGGKTHHVSYGCQAMFNQDRQISKIFPFPESFIIMGDIDKPENRNIRSLIQYMQTAPILRPVNFETLKVGIITDSDLINHSDINKRKKPLVDDFYLPENVELIFATDGTADTILNKMIRWCHKYSTEMINKAKPRL
jgi:hypothetical protein